MSNPLSTRLAAYKEKANKTIEQIAKETGLPVASMYKWASGTRPRDPEQYNSLMAYLDQMEKIPSPREILPPNQLLKEASPPYGPSALVLIPLKSEEKTQPYTTSDAAAGTVIHVDNKPALIANYLEAPFLGRVEGVVEVTGDSMHPTFRNGDRIGVSRLLYIQLLTWGECYYIIDRNLEGYIKRVYESDIDNSVKLVSDHPDQERYPPTIRQWDDIEAVFKIRAYIAKR